MRTTTKRSLKLNNRLLPLLVVGLLLLQLTFPYQGWTILLVGLGGVWLISYFWAKTLTQNLNLSREMRFGWAHVGDRLEERFTIYNYGPVPALWVEISDDTTMPDYTANRVTGIDGDSRNRWYTNGVCTRRGIFTLGPTTLRTGDPFGLYSVSIHFPEASTLTVTPPIVPLPSIQVAPGGRAGEGRSRSNLFEKTVSSAGVRQYLPGDSMRQIHWPTTARQQEFFVRLPESTPSGDWWIFLDLDEQAQVGEGFNSTVEHAIILTASLADRGLRRERAVGLVAHGKNLIWLPPEKSDIQRQKILRSLALVNAGCHPLTHLLSRTQPISGKISSLIIITANTTGDWIEAIIPLMQRGAIPTVLLLDPASFGSPDRVEGIYPTLTQLGITHHAITKELLDQPEARPGHQGQWQWHVSPGGRAIPANRPGDLAWNLLGRSRK